MVVTLIGFRGVGKSSVAPQLAARLGWDWADADVAIVERAGRPIPEIFATEGEPAFRQYEAQVIADLTQRDRLVLSAGGGAVMNSETRRRMQSAGPVVWLQALPETIWSRIGRDLAAGGNRPALTDRDPRAEVEELLARREPVYAAVASMTVSTDDRPVDAIVEEILSQLPGLRESTP